MRDGRLIAINVIAIVCVLATAALAANRVEVESATVGKGGTVTIGVYLENDDQLRGVEFPLVFQSQSSGAFPASIAGQYNPAGRLPYGSYPTPLSGLILNNYYDVPDGSCKPGGFATLAGAGGIVASPSNPDMLLFVRQSVFPASPLNPGTDFPIGTGEPSILFDLTVELCHRHNVPRSGWRNYLYQIFRRRCCSGIYGRSDYCHRLRLSRPGGPMGGWSRRFCRFQ